MLANLILLLFYLLCNSVVDFFPLPIVYISFLIFLYFPCDLLHFPFNQTHVRAYHVNLSCGLHGADDVVLAGEQKVKYFVLIGCLDFWGEDSPPGSPNSKKKKNPFPPSLFGGVARHCLHGKNSTSGCCTELEKTCRENRKKNPKKSLGSVICFCILRVLQGTVLGRC